jgi:hypothetical protein
MLLRNFGATRRYRVAVLTRPKCNARDGTDPMPQLSIEVVQSILGSNLNGGYPIKDDAEAA